MGAKVHIHLVLPSALGERVNALAEKPGVTKSSIIAEALETWLAGQGRTALDDRFGMRLDRLTNALGRIERDGHVLLETLALFVRYELAIHPPLAENDRAGRAIGRERFNAFVEQVGRQIARSERTIGVHAPAEGQPSPKGTEGDGQ